MKSRPSDRSARIRVAFPQRKSQCAGVWLADLGH